MVALLTPISSDGDYLDDDWLAALRQHPFEDLKEAAHFLVETFPVAVRCMWCPSIAVMDTVDGIYGPVKFISFSTGGWSGAEELIGIVLKHFWLRHFHTLWQVGGHYEFRVPVQWLI